MQLPNLTEQITQLHKDCINAWKKNGVQLTHSGILQFIEENHAFNFNLWHAEDRARRDDLGAEFVYKAKREIDEFNQQRNNRMEAIDAWLVKHLQPEPHTSCTVHSETPGMMIDRLSIMALKAYHMELQTRRKDVDDAHIHSCQNKLKTIQQQQLQLQHCLRELLEEVQNKTRTFRVYHQFKMYNDPTLNPEIYQTRK